METKSEFSLEKLKSQTIQKDLFKVMNFDDYLKLVVKKPSVVYSAYQRLYQAINHWGLTKYRFARRDYVRYKIFDDPFDNGKDAVYGLDRQLMRLVDVLRAAAARLGQERRIFLLHGPVGSSKSTLARLLRKALEYYTKTEEGELYTFSWLAKDEKDREILGLSGSARDYIDCPIHEEPLRLLPADTRDAVVGELNKVSDNGGPRLRETRIVLEGELCPRCRFFYHEFLRKYSGEKDAWKKIIENHIQVRRLVFSEIDRVGIGSFRPKDEKNQDSTELTGDINYRKIAEYGAESDPRAFNFDGEFQVANRGVFYVEEIFKLDKAFLYDFLGATQEHVVKPKRFREMHIDVVLIGGTNNPEYEKVRNDETMEAFGDRTTRIDIPYVLKLSEELKIYQKIYSVEEKEKKGRHVAPYTVLMASLWAVLTRMKNSAHKEFKLSLLDKIRLYDGKSIQEVTEEHLYDLMEEFPDEGMSGISPRYIQDMLGNAAVSDLEVPCITWFAVKNFLKGGLKYHYLIKQSKSQNANEYAEALEIVDKEFTLIVQGEIQAAIAGDKEVEALFQKYIDNVTAYIDRKRKVKNEAGEWVPPDERLMREIEKEIGVAPNTAQEYRDKIVRNMGLIASQGKKFNYKSDEELYKALRKLIFKQRKDVIKLHSLQTGVVSEKEKEEIENLKSRMIKNFNYCDHCARLVLAHVASIFSRGDVAE